MPDRSLAQRNDEQEGCARRRHADSRRADVVAGAPDEPATDRIVKLYKRSQP